MGGYMSSVTRLRNGKYTYLYESTSYRDEKKRPRNDKFIVGKIDPVTGEYIYKPEYIELMKQRGTPIDIPEKPKVYTSAQIMKSTIKEYGAFYLYESISNESGLLEILKDVFPDIWQDIFTLATFFVSTEDPFLYLDDWLDKSESLPVCSLTSKRISELLSAISSEKQLEFYNKWSSFRSEKEYLALDITSISSYSELIEDVDWGHNRDGEDLAQVNLCMLIGEESRLPVYQTVYNGSLKDVSTLKTTLALIKSTRLDQINIVMDKGFASTKNINDMMEDNDKINFIIALPFTLAFAKKQVQSEKKDIDSLKNTIVTGAEILRGVMHERSFGNNHKLFTHTFYNASKAVKVRDDLFGHVTLLKKEAEKDPNNSKYLKDYAHYLKIRKSDKNKSGYTVNIRDDVVEKELANAGWLVLASNDVDNSERAISIYRIKDVVEKGFYRLKNCMDLGILRVQSGERMRSKLFVGFIALIIMSGIHKVMLDKEIYNKMTMKKMIKTLDKLKIQYINGDRILYPVTKAQKEIFEAFKLEQPL
jgi:transposase